MSLIIGTISGVLAGMGLGGGSLLIPALVLLMNISQKTAQAANLIGFIPAAVASLIMHRKNKLLHLRSILIVSVFGLAACLLTAMISVRLNNRILRTVFAVFLLVMGGYEIFKKRK